MIRHFSVSLKDSKCVAIHISMLPARWFNTELKVYLATAKSGEYRICKRWCRPWRSQLCLWRWWPCGKADICAMCQCVEFDQRNKVAQLCPTLCDPMDYTVHGILQARILEWVAFPFSRGSSQPKNRTVIKCNRYQFCITCQGKCFSCISAISHPVSGFSEPCFKLVNRKYSKEGRTRWQLSFQTPVWSRAAQTAWTLHTLKLTWGQNKLLLYATAFCCRSWNLPHIPLACWKYGWGLTGQLTWEFKSHVGFSLMADKTKVILSPCHIF